MDGRFPTPLRFERGWGQETHCFTILTPPPACRGHRLRCSMSVLSQTRCSQTRCSQTRCSQTRCSQEWPFNGALPCRFMPPSRWLPGTSSRSVPLSKPFGSFWRRVLITACWPVCGPLTPTIATGTLCWSCGELCWSRSPLRHPTVESCLAELRRNDGLCCWPGIDPEE